MENEACGFSDFDRGAMRQKMAIFKGGNSVWRVQKILNGEIMEAMLLKIIILFKENWSQKTSFYMNKIDRT